MPTNQGLLRIESEGGVRVSEVKNFLAALDTAYNSLFFFERLTEGFRQQEPHLAPPWMSWLDYALTRRGRRIVTVRPSTIASFVPSKSRLVLLRVRLESPGFYEFVGSLNLFETLRQYLRDRHERRKDKEYREASERERLGLENAILRNKDIASRIRNLKELGATDEDLAPLLNELLFKPLEGLNQFQDKGLIQEVEVKLFESDLEQESE